MNDLKQQAAALWSDFTVWVGAHPVIVGMAAAIVILMVIAVCR